LKRNSIQYFENKYMHEKEMGEAVRV